jgi:hypothetical protein
VVVGRDPYDWVLARARFFLSDTFPSINWANLGILKNIKKMIFFMIWLFDKTII